MRFIRTAIFVTRSLRKIQRRWSDPRVRGEFHAQMPILQSDTVRGLQELSVSIKTAMLLDPGSDPQFDGNLKTAADYLDGAALALEAAWDAAVAQPVRA